MLRASDMRKKSLAELESELGDLRKEGFRLRMQKTTQQLTNTSSLGRVRREIAIVLTVMREKRAVAAQEAE